MRVSIASYPYPVLGNGEDVAGKFNPSLSCTLEHDRVSLRVKYEIENATIEQLVHDRRATYCIELECPSTFFRQIYKTYDSEQLIEIDAGELRDKVTFNFSICATDDIAEYNPEGVHPALDGAPSYVEKGDVIADGKGGWFIADKAFDPLKAPVTSFMKIIKGSYQTGPMSINYGDESILLTLSKDDYDTYLMVKGGAKNTLHSALVFPALLDVLWTMKDEKAAEQWKEQPWFSKIQQIAVRQNISLDEPIEATQKILDLPLSRTLDEIKTNSLQED